MSSLEKNISDLSNKEFKKNQKESKERLKQHNIEFTFTDAELRSLLEKKKKEGKAGNIIVVVIDVIRFTTNVAAALEAGAEKIVPVSSPSQALEIAEKLRTKGESVVVAAEKGGEMVSGADRGNSPRYEKDEMRGKTLVISTSHGTNTVNAAKGASKIILAGMRNAKSVTEYIENSNKDIIFATSGSKYPSVDKADLDNNSIKRQPATRFDQTIASKDDVLVGARIASGLTETGNFFLPEEQDWIREGKVMQDSFNKPIKIKLREMVKKLENELQKKGVKESIEKTRWANRIKWIDEKGNTITNQKDIEYLAQYNVSEIIPVVSEDGTIVKL